MREIMILVFSLLACNLFASLSDIEKSEGPVHFDAHLLDLPRQHAVGIIEKFSYNEISQFTMEECDTNRIILYNGYAQAGIRNPEDFLYDKSRYRVKRVEVVFTKYPFNPKDWLTNYYDLLSWRLQELFAIDATLNDPSIEWDMVLQTAGKTASQARRMFHGLVLTLEPLASFPGEEIPEEKRGRNNLPLEIKNEGFLFQQERNPAMYRSPLIFTPDPGGSKRQMDPRKLKCPSW